jgi:hypothetical protein
MYFVCIFVFCLTLVFLPNLNLFCTNGCLHIPLAVSVLLRQFTYHILVHQIHSMCIEKRGGIWGVLVWNHVHGIPVVGAFAANVSPEASNLLLSFGDEFTTLWTVHKCQGMYHTHWLVAPCSSSQVAPNKFAHSTRTTGTLASGLLGAGHC